MTEPDSESEGLAALAERLHALSEQHRFAAQEALLEEAIPRARQARDFKRLISFLFTAANGCNHSRQPLRQRTASIELVTLLESIEAARRVQPDLDEGDFELDRRWYTACAYDNLAVATACLEGYNSEGMYNAVNEGIEKCRQTGKHECITCFREYAVEVSIAADDLDRAAQQAQELARREKDQAQHDRRSVAWKDLGRIAELRGDLRGALRAYEKGYEVCESYHDPEDMALGLLLRLETCWVLLGEPEGFERFRDGRERPAAPERGQSQIDDQAADELRAVRACVAGRFAEAIALREDWCGVHAANRNTAAWFEARCRLIAAHRLAGDDGAAAALSEDTAARARDSRDWVTLRRLAVLPGPGVNPLATLSPFSEGPFARVDSASELEAAPAPADREAPAGPSSEGELEGAEERPSAVVESVKGWLDKIRAAKDAEEDAAPVLAELAAELKATPPAVLEGDDDAWAWLRGALACVRGGAGEARLWKQARLVARGAEDSCDVALIFADLADACRLAEELAPERRPGADEVEGLYRRALDLDIERPDAYFNAGVFYVSVGKVGEAERCYARACRLARAWPPPALCLAEVYRQGDRPSDALQVLDLAVRHGCRDPQVVWEAGLAAFGLERWELTASFFELYEELQPDSRWGGYYRSVALLNLARWDQALAALAAIERDDASFLLLAASIRSRAEAGRGLLAPAREAIEAALNIPLAAADEVSFQGLQSAYERLRLAAEEAGDAAVLASVMARIFRAGLASDAVFAAHRKRPDNPVCEEAKVYRAVLEQSLPESWKDDPACPGWEQDWVGYRVAWYVIAEDEAGARALAEEGQGRCADEPARLLSVERADERVYRDRCGIYDHNPRQPIRAGDMGDVEEGEESDSGE